MSVKVSSWVWHGEETADLAGNEMILLLALADVADDNGRCRFMTDDDDLTYGGLARKARVDRRTIERLIPKLRMRGLLNHSKGTKSKPNEFTILVPWAQSSTDKLSGQAGADSPTAGTHSPTPLLGFPDNGDNHSSYRRIDVVTSSSSEVADAPLRADVAEILDLLDAEIERNGGRKPSRTQKNIDAARLLLDRDGRTVDQVSAAIRWCQADEFWRSNILSMSKLRDKYEQLRLQAARGRRMSTVDAGRAADALLAQREQLAVSS